MADRPILFNGPMVRAILSGAKTQTRRPLKKQPQTFLIDGKECDVSILHIHGDALPSIACGRVINGEKMPVAVGDRLWVRETWAVAGIFSDVVEVRYKANENSSRTEFVEQIAVSHCGKVRNTWPRYRPSIHMPRWASRLTLIVKDVRVQRLRDISEADAMAEGAPKLSMDEDGNFYELENGTHVCGFAGVWNHAYGQDAWDRNPFVAAITFDVVRQNIDRIEAC